MVTIEVSETNWLWLRDQKGPGDSFNDVVDNVREQLESIPEPPTVDIDAVAERHDLSTDERAAVAAVVKHLRTTYPGWERKQTVLDEVYEEYPSGKQSGWWWRRLLTHCLVEDGIVEKLDDSGLVRLADD